MDLNKTRVEKWVSFGFQFESLKGRVVAINAFGHVDDVARASVLTQLCLDQNFAETKILKQVRQPN